VNKDSTGLRKFFEPDATSDEPAESTSPEKGHPIQMEIEALNKAHKWCREHNARISYLKDGVLIHCSIGGYHEEKTAQTLPEAVKQMKTLSERYIETRRMLREAIITTGNTTGIDQQHMWRIVSDIKDALYKASEELKWQEK